MNKIDKILKKNFFKKGAYYREFDEINHCNLCACFRNTPYKNAWLSYWDEIKENKIVVTDFFRFNKIRYKNMSIDERNFKASLLRLLVVEDFKQYLREKRKNDKSKRR